MDLTLEAVLEKGFSKVARMEGALTAFPHITRNGEWLTHEYGHWTGGFWNGLLWLKSLYSENSEASKLKAISWAKKLAFRKNDNKTHDQGFIFGPSCILGYHLTGESQLAELAAAGAKNMADLFENRVGLVLAWDEPGYEGVAIVDTIMNLPLLVWVSEIQNRTEFLEIACTAADNIMKYHIRDDFSTYHTVRWDTETFQVVERGTHQGFNEISCWSRGQAWALYGFSNMYRYTSNKRYLQTAENLANYFWEQLDTNLFLPRWDFVFKNHQNQPIDAAAASIAASGMLLLSDLFLNEEQMSLSLLWEERATVLLKSLVDHCLYTDIDKYGIIEKATVDKPRSSGVGESTMYGDYYFMESIFRKLNKGNRRLLDILY